MTETIDDERVEFVGEFPGYGPLIGAVKKNIELIDLPRLNQNDY